jgi:hypothetical protein
VRQLSRLLSKMQVAGCKHHTPVFDSAGPQLHQRGANRGCSLVVQARAGQQKWSVQEVLCSGGQEGSDMVLSQLPSIRAG